MIERGLLLVADGQSYESAADELRRGGHRVSARTLRRHAREREERMATDTATVYVTGPRATDSEALLTADLVADRVGQGEVVEHFTAADIAEWEWGAEQVAEAYAALDVQDRMLVSFVLVELRRAYDADGGES